MAYRNILGNKFRRQSNITKYSSSTCEALYEISSSNAQAWPYQREVNSMDDAYSWLASQPE
jgi:hypothetical protein